MDAIAEDMADRERLARELAAMTALAAFFLEQLTLQADSEPWTMPKAVDHVRRLAALPAREPTWSVAEKPSIRAAREAAGCWGIDGADET